MHNSGAVIGAVIGGVLAYAAFLGGIIYLSLRWSRRILERKAEAFASDLVAAGARFIQHGESRGLYRGREAEYELGSQRVFVNAYYVSRSSVRLNLRIASGVYPWVTLYPEGALDRLGKSLSLNREVQLGDESFDAAVYIHSTEKSEERVRDLFASEALRGAVRELLAGGYRVQFSSQGVEAYQTQYALNKAGEAGAAHAFELLARIANEAPRFEPSTLTPESPPMSNRVLGLAIAAAVFGGAVAIGVSQGGGLLDSNDVGKAILLASSLWVVFVAALVPYLRGRSNALQLLVVYGAVGIVGFPAGGGVALLAANRALDAAPAEDHVVTVLRMHERHRDLHTTSWRAGRTEERFVVKRAFLHTLQVGDHVLVRTHPGRFGWPWFEPVTTRTAGDAPSR